MPDAKATLPDKDGEVQNNESDPKEGDGEETDDTSQEGDDGEETVTVKKSELEKLKQTTENYKKGFHKYKEMVEGEDSDDEKEDEDEKQPDDDEVVTKRDLRLQNRRQAESLIRNPQPNDPEEVVEMKETIKKNWDDIVELYSPRRGQETVQDIVEDIKDAYHLYRTRYGEPESEEEKKARKNFSVHGKTGGSSPSNNKKKREPILTQGNTPIEEWYGSSDE